MDRVVQGHVVTKEDRVPRDHRELQAQWDPRDFLDSLEQMDCLEDPEVLVIQVVMARLEYLVDTLVSTLPSKLVN